MAELAAMPKYEAYKDSGVEWLGDIPESWDISKIKNYSNIYNGDSLNEKQKARYSSEDENHLAYISSKDINVQNAQVNYLNGLRIPRWSSYKVCPTNSTLMCIEGGSAGKKIAFTNQNVCFVNKLACFVAKKGIDNKYLFFYLSSKTYKDQFFNAMTGLIGGVAISSIKNFRLVLPPVTVQVAIANFLDKKTAQLDEAIAIKEKQIELLKERKKIIIQQAVTQGLNPNAPMKDSGVDWIGEIPEHWEISKVRYLGVTQNGISAGAEYFGSGFPFVSYGDVYKNRELPLAVSGLAKSTINDRNQYSILENDILFTRTSETAEEIGFASICMKTIEDSTFAGFLIRFRPTSKLFKGFSKYYFNSAMMREYFVKQTNLVIRASLSQELLKNLPVLLPSLDEQKIIFNHLEHETGKVEEAIDLQIKQIEKLKEYKTTLINSAVTGKIKVPEVDSGC